MQKETRTPIPTRGIPNHPLRFTPRFGATGRVTQDGVSSGLQGRVDLQIGQHPPLHFTGLGYGALSTPGVFKGQARRSS